MREDCKRCIEYNVRDLLYLGTLYQGLACCSPVIQILVDLMLIVACALKMPHMHPVIHTLYIGLKINCCVSLLQGQGR